MTMPAESGPVDNTAGAQGETAAFPAETVPPAAPVMRGLGAIGGGAASAPSPEAPLPASPILRAPGYAPAAPDGVAGGMRYAPAAVQQRPALREPTGGERILRGLGWGAICGQWWTLWNVVWQVLIYGVFAGKMSAGVGAGVAVAMAVLFGFVGSLAGLIIGAINAEVNIGAGIGIGAGMLMLGLEFLIFHSPAILVNAFFWFFTGRYVGASITRHVQKPVEN